MARPCACSASGPAWPARKDHVAGAALVPAAAGQGPPWPPRGVARWGLTRPPLVAVGVAGVDGVGAIRQVFQRPAPMSGSHTDPARAAHPAAPPRKWPGRACPSSAARGGHRSSGSGRTAPPTARATPRSRRAAVDTPGDWPRPTRRAWWSGAPAARRGSAGVAAADRWPRPAGRLVARRKHPAQRHLQDVADGEGVSGHQDRPSPRNPAQQTSAWADRAWSAPSGFSAPPHGRRQGLAAEGRGRDARSAGCRADRVAQGGIEAPVTGTTALATRTTGGTAAEAPCWCQPAMLACATDARTHLLPNRLERIRSHVYDVAREVRVEKPRRACVFRTRLAEMVGVGRFELPAARGSPGLRTIISLQPQA